MVEQDLESFCYLVVLDQEMLPLLSNKCCLSGSVGFSVQVVVNIRDEHICQFTSDSKERFCGNAGVVVTTYNMVAFGGKRSEESEKIIEEIRNREWGLLLMEEVHVVWLALPSLTASLGLLLHL